MTKKHSSKKTSKKKPIPIAPTPLKSRKRARVITTLFHKYSRELEKAEEEQGSLSKEKIEELKTKLKNLGGREAYQQASQVSTSYHSTSKWVLGYLSRLGWLHGVPLSQNTTDVDKKQKEKQPRKVTKILEVGAINTELLNAAAEEEKQNVPALKEKRNKLHVRAIDLRSSHPGIEEKDILTLPLEKDYHVIVCSMVINCITRADQRGLLLTRLYNNLLPGGLCFLTLPGLCLTQSPHLDKKRFLELLEFGIGFDIKETKASPKIEFFILERPLVERGGNQQKNVWSVSRTLFRGKKYRNTFDVTI